MSLFRNVLVLMLVCSASFGLAGDRIRQAPQPLRGGDHGVGMLAPAVKFSDIAGTTHDLADLAKQHRAVVIAMTSTSCPLSLKYFPTLVDLSKRYAEQDVRFVLVNSVAADKLDAMQQAAKQLASNASYVFDEQGDLATAIGATTTTDVIVVNPSRTVVYHGAVDDQYGFGYSRDTPQHPYLVNALDSILNNQTPLVEATAAPGCQLSVSVTTPGVSDVTYHGRISRLMNRHCVTCHREDGVGPFALTSYDELVSHAPMIREVIERGIMPPWFAAHEDPTRVSPWENDASLTTIEKRDLIAWIEGDQAEGDSADAPQPLVFSGRWSNGEPDAVLAFPEPVQVKATGFMPYVNVPVETNFGEDKWIQAVEILPGDLAVVHHVLIYMVEPGGRVENPIDYWAVYTPGNGLHVYPPGYARRLPQGAKLVFQMHYTPNGTATEDLTQIGFQFADQPPQYEVQTASVINARFSIPPGAKDYQVEATLDIPVDVEVLGYLPHHHLRGVAAKYELIKPEGDTELLLDVPEYDFNWQLFYQYANPPIFPKGSTIKYTAKYDNSADNPANPNPKARVRFGDQTYDEMHIGYLEYAVPRDAPWADEHRNLRGKLIKDFAALDTDADGELSPAEVTKLIPEWAPFQISIQQVQGLFLVIDKDKSGGLNEEEFQQVLRQFRGRGPGRNRDRDGDRDR
jgi:peroxiredoxin/mono/diheme cytochrome c family protein